MAYKSANAGVAMLGWRVLEDAMTWLQGKDAPIAELIVKKQ